jgi:hypothetical protein
MLGAFALAGGKRREALRTGPDAVAAAILADSLLEVLGCEAGTASGGHFGHSKAFSVNL